MHDPSHALRIGEDARGIFLEAEGHIRAVDCYPLRDEVLSRLEGSECPPAVFLDLSECRYMDSTFIGLLVAMEGKLKKCGGRLHVINSSDACIQCLQKLGLEKILRLEKLETTQFPPCRPLEDHGTPAADFILRTHEALMEKSEEARKKFGTLKEMLEKKLRGT
jgi:anti-anti-sigma factor